MRKTGLEAEPVDRMSRAINWRRHDSIQFNFILPR